MQQNGAHEQDIHILMSNSTFNYNIELLAGLMMTAIEIATRGVSGTPIVKSGLARSVGGKSIARASVSGNRPGRLRRRGGATESHASAAED